MLYQTVGAL
jgi:hypothetical protein